MAGGTKLTASKNAAVLILTEAPNTIPATTTRVTAANQASIALDRVIPFNMLFTLYSGRPPGEQGCAVLSGKTPNDVSEPAVETLRARRSADAPRRCVISASRA